MMAQRLFYRNWIVDLGYDPEERLELLFQFEPPHEPETLGPEELARLDAIGRRVIAAVERLGDRERAFIERFYFMGQSYREISHETYRAVHKLERIHSGALKKLRRFLADLAREEYGLEPGPESACPICRSPEVDEINRFIRERDPRATWRPILAALRERFHVTVTTPQILIGHAKYHL